MAEVSKFPDERYAVMKSDKTNNTYTLQKDITGHRFFEFKTTAGQMPKELQGKYTSLDKGIKAFEEWERTVKKSQAARNDELDKARKARRAKLHTETS